LLQRSVPGRVVLPGRGLGLRGALVEIGRGQELLVGQLSRAFKLALRQLLRGLRVGDFRHPFHVEGVAAPDAEPSLDLGDVGLRLVGLRRDLGAGDANELGVDAYAAAALDGGRHDAAVDLRRHLRFFLGHERAADAHEARDRSGGDDAAAHRHGDGFALGGEGTGLLASAACGHHAERDRGEHRDEWGTRHG
jgi:hypothetical protein